MQNLFSPGSSKLPDVGTSIFATMSKMAIEYNAINLSQGFPDFNCSEELLNLVHKYQKDGFNQYAPMPGVLQLREMISEKIQTLYKHNYDVNNEITITAGATQALFTAISCIIKKGDEVIIIEPAYDSYLPVVKLNGGIPVFVSLSKDDFSFDWNAVINSITGKTKMIIINSPHNPTGSILSENDLRILEEITRNTNIVIVSDEVYEHIIFDKNKHVSLSQSEELSMRSFIISSFGKTFHTTGWKIGYCAAPERLTSEFRKIHQFVVFAVNTPIQYAYAEYLSDATHYLDLPFFYQKKRDYLIALLRGSRFILEPAKGTYFQLLDYSDISEMNDVDFAIKMTRETGVAVIPVSPFCNLNKDRKLVRVCFAKNEEVIQKACEKLNRV